MPTVIGLVNGTIREETQIRQNGNLLTKYKRFSEIYIVLADSLSDDGDVIKSATGIPPLLYPSGGCLCRGHRPEEQTRLMAHPSTGVPTALWHVETFFDNEFDPTDRDPNEAPPSRKPKHRWTGDTEEETLEKDAINGNPIVTPAGEPIVETGQIVCPTLEIIRYENHPFDPDVMLNYANHTNSDPFWGAPRGCAYMLPMSTDEEVVEGVTYDRVTYRIKFKIKKDSNGTMLEGGWMARPLANGYMYLPHSLWLSDEIPGLTALVKYQAIIAMTPAKRAKYAKVFVDENGNPAKVNVDEYGFLQDDTTANPYGIIKPVHYLEFNRCPEINFNQLTLGPF